MDNILRVKKEYEELREDFVSIVWIEKITINHWKAYIEGPEGTVYQGGIFKIDIKIPEDYPISRPKMHFGSHVWHPNIYAHTGCIGLPLLKHNWTPQLDIRKVLLAIQDLLRNPDPRIIKRQSEGYSRYKRIQGKQA